MEIFFEMVIFERMVTESKNVGATFVYTYINKIMNNDDSVDTWNLLIKLSFDIVLKAINKWSYCEWNFSNCLIFIVLDRLESNSNCYWYTVTIEHTIIVSFCLIHWCTLLWRTIISTSQSTALISTISTTFKRKTQCGYTHKLWPEVFISYSADLGVFHKH